MREQMAGEPATSGDPWVLSDPTSGLPDPRRTASVEYEPSLSALRSCSEHEETRTVYGSASYVSRVRSRSADRTKNALDDEFGAEDWRLVEEAVDEVEAREMVCLDRQLGRHPEHTYVCRLFVPRAYGRIALAWAKLLEPAPAGIEPDFVTIQLPDHDRRAIRVLPDEGLTVVCGSDYTGEAKKSFLRLFMYQTKQAGGLGLHAGSKHVTVETEDGLEGVDQLFLGLSATGKSTLTGHGLWLEEPERTEMRQDDVCALLPDGAVAGSEGGGLYVKTIGLDAKEQPGIYHAATQPEAVFENVSVDADGTVDFDDDRYTRNGRAVIRRADLPCAGEGIDSERADQLFFITRNPLCPPIARLTTRQAAAAFMLGESIETSAGDPDRAGEAIRVVGTNPFIVGPEGEEGNRFLELIEATGIEPYLINTGSVGEREREREIGVADTVAILTAVARGELEWVRDETVGLEVPTVVPGTEIDRFSIAEAYPDAEARLADLRADRRAYLEGYPTLHEEIREAVY
jgi:phosphoenolpyruvate carboxykinase (ATP)